MQTSIFTRVFYWHMMSLFLVGLCSQTICQTNLQSPLLDVVIPPPPFRDFLPDDGVVVPFLIKSNVWPRNAADGPFFQNEMAEIAIGRGIRAKLKDRDQEISLSPGVTFTNGLIVIQGGWRLHKKVPWHPDFFDGCWRSHIMLAYAGGRTVSEANVDMSWNISFIGRLALPVTGLVYEYLKHRVVSELEGRIEKDIPAAFDSTIDGFLHENNLPLNLKDHILAQITPEGLLRVRVYPRRLIVHDVRFPKIDFKPSRVPGSGDNEFNGHGPRVTISANISNTSNDASMTFSMSAKETKSDWSQANGSQTKLFFHAFANQSIVDVLGSHNWNFLENEEVDGHDPIFYRTLIGDLTVYGDHRGTDIGAYTGLQYEPDRTRTNHVVTLDSQ